MGEPGKDFMSEYVVTAGPLSTFEFLYDARLDRIKDLRDFHTMEITEKAISDQKFSDYRRDPVRELAFVSTFMAAIARGHTVMCGFRDAHAQRGAELERALRAQSSVKWVPMRYGASDDDLLVCQLRDFKTDFALLQRVYPPADGEVFFYLTSQNFDIFEIYWERKAGDSQKESDDRFRRAVISFAHESQVTLYVDHEGSFTVLTNPKFMDDATVQKAITDAGRRALMNLTMAPGLFG